MRVILTGRVHTGLPPEEAFVLFTPRGEERWAEGWRPHFPVEPVSDSEPGTVFATHHDTIWVVLDREPDRSISYARITPGDRAGRVMVTLDATGAEVTYDLTALTEESAGRLRAFADDFPAFLRSWEEAIARSLSSSLGADPR
jgi:hypothetical protein